ncbi:MAG: molybdopterin-dependent oxidoreductase [Cyanobacteria bacterium P01_E01_bin.34]
MAQASRRQFLQWGVAASGVWLAGIAIAPQRSEALTVDGKWPLLDLSDFTTPLPDHWVTPITDFYVQSALPQPEITSDDVSSDRWQLTVSGLVNTPISLSLSDIQSQPSEEVYWTLACIGNQAGGELLGNARWQGTRLLPLLEQVGVMTVAQAFALRGADGYETSVLPQELLHPDTMLVYSMNGESLPAQHGYPLRILIPGKYGQKQPKWLTEIEALVEPISGHWERQGWSDRANILTHALSRQVQQERVSIRNRRLTGESGEVAIAGMALASSIPIERVEVSQDGGMTWEIAEHNHPPSPYEWTLWRHRWQLEQGEYRLMARAIAGNETQPLEDIIPLDGNQAVLEIDLDVTS